MWLRSTLQLDVTSGVPLDVVVVHTVLADVISHACSPRSGRMWLSYATSVLQMPLNVTSGVPLDVIGCD